MSDKLVYMARTTKFGEARATRKLAMIALCNAAGDHGDGCDADIETIMETAEVSDRTAKTIRSELVRVGLLVVEHEGGRGRRDRSTYKINVKRLAELQAEAVTYAELLAHPVPEKGETVAPLNVAKGETVAPFTDARKGEDKGEIKGEAKGEAGASRPPDGPPLPLHPLTPPISPPHSPLSLFAALPEKDDRPNCEFVDGRVVIRHGLRTYWLERFEGSEELLELGLIQAAAFVQPNSARPLEAQISAQLARQVAAKISQDKRYAAATARNARPVASKPHGDSRTQAYLAKRRLEVTQ